MNQLSVIQAVGAGLFLSSGCFTHVVQHQKEWDVDTQN